MGFYGRRFERFYNKWTLSFWLFLTDLEFNIDSTDGLGSLVKFIDNI